MIASALRLIDWFVPKAAMDTRSNFGRARMFVFSHLFGPTLGMSIVLFLLGADPSPGIQCGIIATSICAFWLLPFILKYSGNIALVATLSMQNLLFVILYGAYFYGKVASPFLPWLLVALLLGLTFLGDKPVRLISIFISNALVFIYFLWMHGAVERVPLAKLSNVGLISVFGATLYVAWIAIYYGLLLTSESEIEQEVEMHRGTAARLQSLKNKAELANRNKSFFLEKMSHELRTPLNAVIGYSEILLEDATDIDATSQRSIDLQRIKAAGNHLLALVTDVLDISKIENDQFELQIKRFAARPLIEEVASTVAPLLRQNNNTLILQFDPLLGSMVSDETRLRQILINLFANAAKFTTNGTVTVAARRVAGSNGKWMEIDVRDTGIGISKSEIALLFKNFSQAEGARSARREGTGLGLAVSHALCTIMGGGISVHSEPGHGSCFSLRIPTDLSPVIQTELPATGAASLMAATFEGIATHVI